MPVLARFGGKAAAAGSTRAAQEVARRAGLALGATLAGDTTEADGQALLHTYLRWLVDEGVLEPPQGKGRFAL